jgi:hypothetical protein
MGGTEEGHWDKMGDSVTLKEDSRANVETVSYVMDWW